MNTTDELKGRAKNIYPDPSYDNCFCMDPLAVRCVEELCTTDQGDIPEGSIVYINKFYFSYYIKL